MKHIQDAYIVSATRSAVGRAGRGALQNTRPDDLLGNALPHILTQVPSLDTKVIEDAIIGCAMPEAQQGLNVARIGLLLGGLPNTVGGITVNRFFSSGLNAIAMAADGIRFGEADVMIAGGMESISMVPIGGNTPSISPEIFIGDENIGIACGMGLTAEKVAQQWKISREDQDAFAYQSHQKAMAAQAAGEFNSEIFSVKVADRSMNLDRGQVDIQWREFSKDESPRIDTSLEGSAKLQSPFAAKGSVTAGNSSQTSDGVGAPILASGSFCRPVLGGYSRSQPRPKQGKSLRQCDCHWTSIGCYWSHSCRDCYTRLTTTQSKARYGYYVRWNQYGCCRHF